MKKIKHTLKGVFKELGEPDIGSEDDHEIFELQQLKNFYTDEKDCDNLILIAEKMQAIHDKMNNPDPGYIYLARNLMDHGRIKQADKYLSLAEDQYLNKSRALPRNYYVVAGKLYLMQGDYDFAFKKISELVKRIAKVNENPLYLFTEYEDGVDSIRNRVKPTLAIPFLQARHDLFHNHVKNMKPIYEDAVESYIRNDVELSKAYIETGDKLLHKKILEEIISDVGFCELYTEAGEDFLFFLFLFAESEHTLGSGLERGIIDRCDKLINAHGHQKSSTAESIEHFKRFRLKIEDNK